MVVPQSTMDPGASLRELGCGRANSLCLAQGEERGRLTIHDGGAKVNIKDRRKGTQVTYHRHRSNSLYTPEEIRSCPCPSRGRGSPRGLHRKPRLISSRKLFSTHVNFFFGGFLYHREIFSSSSPRARHPEHGLAVRPVAGGPGCCRGE